MLKFGPPAGSSNGIQLPMIVTVSGLSGLTNAYRSVLSATGSMEINGASRWLDANALPAARDAMTRAPANAVSLERFLNSSSSSVPEVLCVRPTTQVRDRSPGASTYSRRRMVRMNGIALRSTEGRREALGRRPRPWPKTRDPASARAPAARGRSAASPAAAAIAPAWYRQQRVLRARAPGSPRSGPPPRRPCRPGTTPTPGRPPSGSCCRSA